MAEGAYQNLGNFILKSQFRTQMFRGFWEADEKRIWWVLYVGPEKGLCGLLWALRASGMEKPRAYQLHDQLFLLGRQIKARTCLLCVVRLREDPCCSGSISQQLERKAERIIIKQTLFSTNDSNFQTFGSSARQIRWIAFSLGLSSLWTYQCLLAYFWVPGIFAVETSPCKGRAWTYGVYRCLHSSSFWNSTQDSKIKPFAKKKFQKGRSRGIHWIGLPSLIIRVEKYQFYQRHLQ